MLETSDDRQSLCRALCRRLGRRVDKHDLDRVLSHYIDDFEMCSPVITKITGEASGVLKGKAQVAAYWRRAFEMFPQLRFERIDTLAGVNSVTIYYQGVSGPAAEVFHFNEAGKVTRAYAHYS